MTRLTKAEILSLTPEQITHLSKTNLTLLKQITSDLQAINKKSYQRLKAKGMDTQFVKAYEKKGGNKSLRGMTAEQVKAEFWSARGGTMAKTRTMKGGKSVYTEMVKQIDPTGKVFPKNIEDMNKEQIADFWDMYHKIKEIHAESGRWGSRGSPIDTELSDIITEEFSKGEKTFEDYKKLINDRYNEIYEERKQSGNYISNPLEI